MDQAWGEREIDCLSDCAPHAWLLIGQTDLFSDHESVDRQKIHGQANEEIVKQTLNRAATQRGTLAT